MQDIMNSDVMTKHHVKTDEREDFLATLWVIRVCDGGDEIGNEPFESLAFRRNLVVIANVLEGEMRRSTERTRSESENMAGFRLRLLFIFSLFAACKLASNIE